MGNYVIIFMLLVWGYAVALIHLHGFNGRNPNRSILIGCFFILVAVFFARICDVFPGFILNYQELVGAIIGALASLIIALGVVHLTYMSQRKILKKQRVEEEALLLTGLLSELEILLQLIRTRFSDLFRDEEIRGEINIEEDYFSIYHAKVAQLGLIEDSEVRGKIVKTYVLAKNFVDSVRSNNRLYHTFVTHLINSNVSNNSEIKKSEKEISELYRNELKRYGLQLKEMVDLLVLDVEDIIKLIRFRLFKIQV